MLKKKDCKVRECFKSHRRELVGAIFLVLATLLTILTLSGLGIIGMFAVGLMLCCNGHICCKHEIDECCDQEEDIQPKATTTTTTTAKKTTKS
ncbi:MAG: hypothetical protein A3E88_01280 [Legionellales bacterium RIFCSPHIGHO2_12_FULL_35_11]|nr:MAG: hypothetical protein A3E88_01280 [Legionellales bacterium RIFCSPHIGHO2_12_FULL_35_11]